MSGTDVNNYAFIDGNYLRRAYEDTMRMMFADVSDRNIDFTTVKTLLQASKVFYYDAVDKDALDAKDRRDRLDAISSLEGFHVREGTITQRKDKKTQKQVDVQLAVEALTHAFHRNVWHISLVAGDLDFKPLVNALVNQGVHVHVFYEPRSAARALYRAADVAAPLRLGTFWKWSTHEYQEAHPCPRSVENSVEVGEILLKTSLWDGREVKFWSVPSRGEFLIFAPAHGHRQSLVVRFNDQAKLEKYFDLMYGPVTWTAA
jgi:uncharacterized LabA/DUF88 family protein